MSAAAWVWRRARAALPLPSPREPLLDALWRDYILDVPDVDRFVALAGGAFQNDHVAFRTLARPGRPAQSTGLAPLAEIFLRRGWRKGGAYAFPDVHLRAIHLSRPNHPRVFVSELAVEELPREVQDALLTSPEPPAPPHDADRLPGYFVAPPPPDPHAVDIALAATAYGAWVLCFGQRVNHFTASVTDIERWQHALRAAGVAMKDVIEGERGAPLRQTATVAQPRPVQQSDGSVRLLPYAYFELAERRPDFDGFVGGQARQLFEMTRVR